MPDRDIIVIGASTGGVETLIQLCEWLPANLPAAICITIHLSHGPIENGYRQVGKPVEIEISTSPLELDPAPADVIDPIDPVERDMRAIRNGKDTNSRRSS